MKNKEKTTALAWIVLIIMAVILIIIYFNTTSQKTTNSTENIQTDQRSIDQKQQDGGYQVIQVGSGQVTVGSTTFSDSITDLGQNIAYHRTTTGKFVRVDLKINNIGLDYNDITLTSFEIIDQDGRRYNAGFDSVSPIEESLSPNIPKIISLIYEVSKDSNNFTLNFSYKKTYNN